LDQPPPDPNAAPEAAPTDVEPTAQTRSGAPRLLGIFLIICGSLLALGGIVGGLITFAASMLVGSVGGMGDMMGDSGGALSDVGQLQPLYNAQGTMKIIEGLLSIVALIAGIWLLGYKRRGRILGLIWAGLALCFLIADFAVYFLVIMPTMSRIMEITMAQLGELPLADSSMMGQLGSFSDLGAVGFVLINLFLAALPLVTLLVLTRRSVAEACN
jgi:hypothetical protein